jgi:hypothetical protein
MANDVFANGREVSCKRADGKTICAFPDVCFTPPQTPATPPGIPIPYPNTAFAKDTTAGSKKVKISGKEVMLKNKSYFKTSTGDEAGCATKKGIITGKIKGKAFYVSWSMDVKFEGKNVVRHLDMTTHNHASPQANEAIPWPYLDSTTLSSPSHACNESGDAQKVSDNCSDPAKKDFSEKCCDARECMLVPYDPNYCCSKDGTQMTPHHVVLKSQFKEAGKEGEAITLQSGGEYKERKAPCICAEGHSASTARHGELHSETNRQTIDHPSVQPNVRSSGKSIKKEARWKVSESESVGSKAAAKVSKCNEDCIIAQVRSGHEIMDISPNDEIRPTTAGKVPEKDTTNL